MKRLSLLALAILWLLNGCGGNKYTEPTRVTALPAPSSDQIAEEAGDNDEPLAENLNNQRLEELYSKGSVPGLDESLDQELKKWELQKKFDMPIQVNKQVRNYIAYFSTDRKQVFSRYLARSTRYLPMIKKVFAEYGLPEDLAYLAMIESGFNNKAVSTAAACGMWQFIKGTAVRYGLAVDSYIDERRDPEKSTRAAAEYLLELYKRFGSWYLAAASYNCGENRVQREIDRNTSMNNYWKLSENFCLPTETKNYVPQMIAATIIAKSPQKYGFTGIAYQPPLKYDLVKVSEVTPLSAAAIAVATNTEEMQALNPELTKNTTPPGYSAYLLKVPPGKKEAFAANITMARAQVPAERHYASRDDYSDSREEVQETRASTSTRSSRRSEGRYRAEKRTAKTAAIYPVAAKSSEKANLCYTVKKGDSLSKIAQRYQTTEANLMAMNNMSGSKQVNKGQVLMVTSRSRAGDSGPVSPKQASAKSRQGSDQETEPLEASMFPNWQKKSKTTTTAKASKQAKGQSSSTSKKKGRSSEPKKKNTASKEKKGEVSQYNVKAKKAKMLAGSKRKKVSCCILRAIQKSIAKMTA